MKIVGIVAEFNPMHYGHKYLIDEAKKITGCDVAICIMSGNFTQAGNITLKNKFERAKIAIENGFDVVIELPTIFATSSAEYFSYNAIKILNDLNCVDYICFGSESGEITTITSIAKKLILNEKKIWNNITESLKQGISFASARDFAISEILTPDELEISSMSNNILAIEYVKALIKLNSNIQPIAIKREEKGNVTSSTNIRQMIAQNDVSASQYILNSDNILCSPVLNSRMYEILKYIIISNGKESINKIHEVTEGLENKIYNEINSSKNYDEFIQNIKSKRYQLSKIKRIMIGILLDITKEKFEKLNVENNSYAHILAINPQIKKELLSTLNKNSSIPVIASINDILESNINPIIKESLELDIKASNVYSVFSNDSINIDYTNKI